MIDKLFLFTQKHKLGLISIVSVLVVVFLWWLGSIRTLPLLAYNTLIVL